MPAIYSWRHFPNALGEPAAARNVPAPLQPISLNTIIAEFAA
jgi:hypothetical protein